MGTEYHKLPMRVRNALDELEIEDSDNLSPKECFERYCAWHGIMGWNLWDLMEACKAAETPTGE